LLDSLAYFILQLNPVGIETKYKQAVRNQREIPVSSCPKHIENIMYTTGYSSEQDIREDENAFKLLLDSLGPEIQPLQKPKKQNSIFSKKLKLGIHDGVWCRVDTDGVFRYMNEFYRIDDNEIQYQPVQTDYGDYYAMDRILASNGKFYDMNYNEVKVSAVGGIMPYDSISFVGSET